MKKKLIPLEKKKKKEDSPPKKSSLPSLEDIFLLSVA
jgi:hypothetical protein